MCPCRFRDITAGKVRESGCPLTARNWVSLDNKTAREIYSRYNTKYLNLSVALAIARGLLPRDTVAPEILEAISQEIAFYREEE